MSKAEKIRAALAGGKTLMQPQLKAAIGMAPGSALRDMIDRGEVRSEGSGRSHVYSLDPDYEPDATARRRERKRTAGSKTIADVARAVAARPDRAAFANLAIESYTASVATLRGYLRQYLDDLEKDATLVSLLAQVEANERIVQAARVA